MKKTTIGFAMTGSFCTFERVLKQMEALVRRGYEVLSAACSTCAISTSYPSARTTR